MKYIYAIYKPIGITSFDVIHKLRKITKIKKIGHAGTLDPAAEGVLIVGFTRKGTREMAKFENTKKIYQAKIILGISSETYDREGLLTKHKNINTPSEEKIKKVIKKFIGKTKQTPPIYSAIKIKGIPAYKYARKNIKINLKSRLINIDKIVLLKYDWPELDLEIVCDKGVYIRSLANDIGTQLETGAYLKKLIRTKCSEFDINSSYTIEKFEKLFNSGKINFLLK